MNTVFTISIFWDGSPYTGQSYLTRSRWMTLKWSIHLSLNISDYLSTRSRRSTTTLLTTVVYPSMSIHLSFYLSIYLSSRLKRSTTTLLTRLYWTTVVYPSIYQPPIYLPIYLLIYQVEEVHYDPVDEIVLDDYCISIYLSTTYLSNLSIYWSIRSRRSTTTL